MTQIADGTAPPSKAALPPNPDPKPWGVRNHTPLAQARRAHTYAVKRLRKAEDEVARAEAEVEQCASHIYDLETLAKRGVPGVR